MEATRRLDVPKKSKQYLVKIAQVGHSYQIKQLNHLQNQKRLMSLKQRSTRKLLKVYKFFQRCRTLQNLILPFANDPILNELLLKTLPSFKCSLKTLTLRQIEIESQMDYSHELNIQRLFSLICKQMLSLRFLDLQLCGQPKINQGVLLERMVPLYVKLTRADNDDSKNFSNMDTRQLNY